MITTFHTGVRPRVGALSLAINQTLRSVADQRRNKAVAPAMVTALSGAILASTLAVVPPHRAAAQEAAPQQTLEEITVTGSRIQRRDFSANAPITTIDENAFSATSTVGVETILNQLPQFVPAVTQFTTTDVQQTANNTIGGAFVSLRGLGPNRNLVLVDGRRAQPANGSMFVDINMIPAAAIQRTEIITGGASAVYGADAVGGVVNFILKDDFEGASIQTRVADTEHGGNQEILISGLFGVNSERGNVMLGLEHATRSKIEQWERDYRVQDMANPATTPTAFFWGSDPWIGSTVPGFGPGSPIGLPNLDAFNAGNYPSQAAVDVLFGPGGGRPSTYVPCTATAPGGFGESASVCTTSTSPGSVGINLGMPNNGSFFVDRATGRVYGGLMNQPTAAGSYRYAGSYTQDSYGNFAGLPYRVRAPDGTIKENNFWQWSSIPLDRDSAFAKGHFDVSDNVRLTGQAMFTRTETETSLGLTADNITFWGAPIPFGTNVYQGDPSRGIPSSVNFDNTTNAAYLPGGRFGLNCPATGGCTERQAWPVPPEISTLYQSRAAVAGFGNGAEADLWLSAPPDYLRQIIGPRGGESVTSTSQLSIGAEGDFPSGDHHWDVNLSTGFTDNLATQTGSVRLSTYRAIMSSPNFGHGFIADPNSYISGFAESIATCTTGLPVLSIFPVSADCVTALSPDLKNQTKVEQSVLEANLTGDLLEMKAGPLGYALGAAYREDSYSFEPDNLSQNQNFIDPIAGLFPNQNSGGEFDVAELYGEMLIPIISDGPPGIDHFNVEVGGRISDWSIPGVETLASYKALIDWGFTPNIRLRGGVNKAHRAPNLAELYTERTQLFGGPPSTYGDQCSRANLAGPYSANPAIAGAAQAAHTEAICRAMMGTLGATTYYNTAQATAGGTGIQNQLGNPDLSEEAADTVTIGLVMNVLENWTLTFDYYTIEIEQMIALEGPDSVYGRCLSLASNPSGSITAPGCAQIFRDPSNGNAANIDLPYTNTGRAMVEGVDINVNWSKMFGSGMFALNSVMNYNMTSETQDRPDLRTFDWAGTTGCALQIQCQGYEYRIFTDLNYSRGAWTLGLRHQYWPSIDPAACAPPQATPTSCSSALATGGGVKDAYQLFTLTGRYQFGDKYTLQAGIENLLDEEPPITGTNPLQTPFANPGSHAGIGLGTAVGSTYDPLGRRYFLSLTMDF